MDVYLLVTSRSLEFSRQSFLFFFHLSPRYLELDRACHPIQAAFPSDPTLGSKAIARRPHRMGLTTAADKNRSRELQTARDGNEIPSFDPYVARSEAVYLRRDSALGFFSRVTRRYYENLGSFIFVQFRDILNFSVSSRTKPSRGKAVPESLVFTTRQAERPRFSYVLRQPKEPVVLCSRQVL